MGLVFYLTLRDGGFGRDREWEVDVILRDLRDPRRRREVDDEVSAGTDDSRDGRDTQVV